MAGSRPDTVTEAEPTTEVMYCARHPQVETLIRCSRCLTPICPKCAIRTPVGLRCPDCARIGRSPLYALAPQHYVLGAIISLALSLIAGALVSQSFLFLTFFLSAPVGGVIAEAVARVLRKRGRAVQLITCVSIALGAVAGPFALLVVAGGLAALPKNPGAYLGAIFNLNAIVYAVIAIGAAWYRLR